ncbi:MAG: UTP--glucose-1-phosphate uridylyltransferase GalU [Ruminococcaceae bacterium]|nr:UTP--glucose-1-phosphate uridylyltransferase GalU [Oscillospiraceae bacterium]
MTVKKAIIPAAGLGTRMLPATKTIPKEMLPIADRPSIQYIVEEAIAAGIEDILIITNRSKAALEDYFDYHPELEERLARAGRDADVKLVRSTADMANISFVRQKETKGLGHAVWTARHFVGNEPFAVLLGDDVITGERPVIGQLKEIADREDAPVVGVQAVSLDAIGRYCSLDVEKVADRVFSVRDLIEKPKPHEVYSPYAILGRYVLTPDIFPILENLSPGYGGEIQLTDALAKLASQRQMLAVEFEGRRFDTGSLEGYLECVIELSLRNPRCGSWLAEYLKNRAKTL